jgi:hypothetical protein
MQNGIQQVQEEISHVEEESSWEVCLEGLEGVVGTFRVV